MENITIGKATSDEINDYRKNALFHWASFKSEVMLIEIKELESKISNLRDKIDMKKLISSENIICFSAVDNNCWLMELIV